MIITTRKLFFLLFPPCLYTFSLRIKGGGRLQFPNVAFKIHKKDGNFPKKKFSNRNENCLLVFISTTRKDFFGPIIQREKFLGPREEKSWTCFFSTHPLAMHVHAMPPPPSSFRFADYYNKFLKQELTIVSMHMSMRTIETKHEPGWRSWRATEIHFWSHNPTVSAYLLWTLTYYGR
jgi:hypothetical protein